LPAEPVEFPALPEKSARIVFRDFDIRVSKSAKVIQLSEAMRP
jgi:hypothetical protein